MHFEGQFVSGNAAGDFRIADLGLAEAIEIEGGLDAIMLELGADAGRVAQVEDGITLIAEEDALEIGGEEAAGPEGGAAAGAASGGEDDVTWEVLGEGTEAIINPGAQGRPAEHGGTALHHELAGMMVELIGMHRSDEGDIVRARGDVREEIGEFDAGLSVALEGARAAHQDGGIFLDKSEANLFGERVGEFLAVEFIELGLGIKEIHLAWGTFHKDEDARFGFGGVMGRLGAGARNGGFGGRAGEEAVRFEQGSEGEQAGAAGGGGEEISARQLDPIG